MKKIIWSDCEKKKCTPPSARPPTQQVSGKMQRVLFWVTANRCVPVGLKNALLMLRRYPNDARHAFWPRPTLRRSHTCASMGRGRHPVQGCSVPADGRITQAICATDTELPFPTHNLGSGASQPIKRAGGKLGGGSKRGKYSKESQRRNKTPYEETLFEKMLNNNAQIDVMTSEKKNTFVFNLKL